MKETKIDALKKWFGNFKGTITAFSGGIDSSLVLYLSRKFLPETTIACISNSPSLKRKDLELANAFCSHYRIPLEIIETDELSDKRYNSNPRNRCFYCKTHLYNHLLKLRKKYPGYVILNGTNKDDFGDYRPGLEAADAFEVRSPLAETGLIKSDVRELARILGLPNWDKPSSPCLSSRIPYGQTVNPEKLKQIESAEEILNHYGFDDVRIRHYENEARIEVPVIMLEELKKDFMTIRNKIIELGFDNCIIDEEGLISGKLNRPLMLQENG